MSYECIICNKVFSGHHREHECEGGRIVQPSELREYRDMDNNPVGLDKLCRDEPEWAANQIRDRDQLVAKVAELEAAQRPGVGLPDYKALLNKALSTIHYLYNSRAGDVYSFIDNVRAGMFNTECCSDEWAEQLCITLNRDPETGARVEDGEEVDDV